MTVTRGSNTGTDSFNTVAGRGSAGGLLSWLRLHLLLRHTAGLYLPSGSLPLLCLRLGPGGDHALVFPKLEYQHSNAVLRAPQDRLDTIPFLGLVLSVLSQHGNPRDHLSLGSLSQELLLEAWAAGGVGKVRLGKWEQVGVGDRLRTRRRTQMSGGGVSLQEAEPAPKEELKNSPGEQSLYRKSVNSNCSQP